MTALDLLNHHVGSLRLTDLQQLGRRWLGPHLAGLYKDDLLVAVRRAIYDPARVQAVAAGLRQHERAVLGALKEHRGVDRGDLLEVGLRVALPLEQDLAGDSDVLSDALDRMVGTGLILPMDPLPPSQRARFQRDHTQYSGDPRLLDLVLPLKLQPLSAPLQPAQAPTLTAARHASAIALDIIRALELIRGQGGIARTRAGALAIPDCKRLAKALGWGDDPPAAYARVREPVQFLLCLLRAADLLIERDGRLGSSPDAEEVLRLPPAVICRGLLRAYQIMPDWSELTLGRTWSASSSPCATACAPRWPSASPSGTRRTTCARSTGAACGAWSAPTRRRPLLSPGAAAARSTAPRARSGPESCGRSPRGARASCSTSARARSASRWRAPGCAPIAWSSSAWPGTRSRT